MTNRRKEFMPPRICEMLRWYESDCPGTLANLRRILGSGTLADTGRLVILPVDQGFEHGPDRSFIPNPPASNPRYHFELALEAGCNAYAAPLGFLEAGARHFAGELPLILKLNDHEMLFAENDPLQAVTGSVEEALRLGCAAIGFTVYPGSAQANIMYEQFQAIAEQAKRAGLVVVAWSYPRGQQLNKDAETAIDVVAYAAQIAAQLGAHIIKVKLPTVHIAHDDVRALYERHQVPTSELAQRVKHVVQSTFDGRRIVIFSGGARRSDEELLRDVRAIRDGGGFGSIIGRNAFQRPRGEAVALLNRIMAIYAEQQSNG